MTLATAPHHVLVLNPNTTASITALLQRHTAAALGTAAVVHTATARFGAPYIACEASYAVAAHAALDAWAGWCADHPQTAPSAVLVGCFGDPGLEALRESSPVPVTGLAEAAFAEAAGFGRFAVVTGGARWRPILQRLAHALGHGTALAGIHTVAPSGAQLAADPDGARALLAEACRDAVRTTGADAVVLGGAGLAGMAAALQPLVAVPVIDSVQAGARQLLRLAGRPGARPAAGLDSRWSGVSPALQALGPA